MTESNEQNYYSLTKRTVKQKLHKICISISSQPLQYTTISRGCFLFFEGNILEGSCSNSQLQTTPIYCGEVFH